MRNSRRKWRLFALGCLERHIAHLGDSRGRDVFAMLARDAEDEWSFTETLDAHELAIAILRSVIDDSSEQRWYYAQEAVAQATLNAVQPARESHTASGCRTAAGYFGTEARERERHRQAALVRDIFGNPFRPVALDSRWLTFDVQALARGIYDEKAFDRMPILADALQDAGCDNSDVLHHCRDPKQTHVRGCWVLDLLLGKS